MVLEAGETAWLRKWRKRQNLQCLDRVDATNTAARSAGFGPSKIRARTSANKSKLAIPTAGMSTVGLAINPNSDCRDVQSDSLALALDPPESDIATSLVTDSPGPFSASATSAFLLASGNLLMRHPRQVPVN